MLSKENILQLLACTETYRVEKTISTTNTDKFCEAICAFSNDMSNSRKKGYLLIGVHDNGSLSGLRVTDELQKKIASIRVDGNILPMPLMTVDYVSFEKGDVLVVEVTPSSLPPVRYKGRTYIRIGPRKDIATLEEERILSERRSANFPTYDSKPCFGATIDDLDIESFLHNYLPKAISNEIIRNDQRSVKEQLASLRLYNLQYDCPTNAAIVLFGKNPLYHMMGNYIQYVHWDGDDNASDVLNDYVFKGNLMEILPILESFVNTTIVQKHPVSISTFREEYAYNFPQWAMRELVMNAVMHRDYQSNMPIRIYKYRNRVEILNAGGLYGLAKPDNFPNVNDYRNPVIAEAMKVLGYVNKYNSGIARVQKELLKNKNGKANFDISLITAFLVVVQEADTATLKTIFDKNEKDNTMVDSLASLDLVLKMVLKNKRYIVDLQNDNVFEEFLQKNNLVLKETLKISLKNMLSILALINKNNQLSLNAMAESIHISYSSLDRLMSILRNGMISRIGPKKGGYWKINWTDTMANDKNNDNNEINNE